MHESRSGRRALLIVDVQVGMFHGLEKPYRAEEILENINLLITRAHDASAPVFAVRHIGPQGSPIEPGSPLSQLLPLLAVDATRDTVFDKTRPNSFFGTGLADWLADAGVDELVIAGLKTEYCIDATCRAAADLGFRPVLVADAHSTMDSPVLPAHTIIAHHNRTLAGAFATLVDTAQCQF
ncbi:MAG: cysteine hydrolase family protein [Janthinobacterium lividum]